MASFQEFLAADNFAGFLKVEMLEAKAGSARASLTIRDHHLNSHKTVHGGVIFSLADIVLAAASNSHGPQAVAINASVSYLKAVSEGVLFAEAREVSINPVLATYEVRVTSQSGELIATFQGMVYRKRNSTNPP